MLNQFYKEVPKQREANLKFRLSLLEAGDNDPKAAEQIYGMCRDDILFYFNTMLWVFEPRTKKKYPFITWDFQDEPILKVKQMLRTEEPGRHDILIEKSRDMGVSWFVLGAFDHDWLFESDSTFIFGSRAEKWVDGDASSLLWKIRFMHDHLPSWILGKGERKHANMKCEHANGSVHTGESTNSNFARSGRYSAAMLDEFAALESAGCDADAVLAATADVTQKRVFVSTHQGVNTAFYRLRERMLETCPEQVLRLHWRDHPAKGKGLYTSDINGKLQIIDKTYSFPSDYEYVTDGKLRSPAYDEEGKTRHPREMAQEWDIDPQGSDWQYFDRQLIDKLSALHGMPPLWEAEIEYSRDPVKFIQFVPRKGGRFKFWTWMDTDGFAPRDRSYAQGVDVSEGQNSSNSTIVVGDNKSREMMMEYADPLVKPVVLAEIAVAVAQCFAGTEEGAFMIWEAPGPGRAFGDTIIQLGYRNIYYRTNETSLKQKRTDTPGWWPTVDNKKSVFAAYAKALREGAFVNHSKESYREHHSIIYTKSGAVEHSSAVNSTDPSGAGANHGDRVTGAVLCVKGMTEMSTRPDLRTELSEAPPQSIAGRRAALLQARRMAPLW